MERPVTKVRPTFPSVKGVAVTKKDDGDRVHTRNSKGDVFLAGLKPAKSDRWSVAVSVERIKFSCARNVRCCNLFG